MVNLIAGMPMVKSGLPALGRDGRLCSYY